MAIRVVNTVKRKCGKRVTHGLYAVSAEGDRNGVLAGFTTLYSPVPYQVKLHRGPRIVDAHAILERQPMEEWWVGSSKDAEQKKSADAWAQDTFGMTIHRRLEIGECVQCQDADDALGMLVGKIFLDRKDNRIADYLREITRKKIQELGRVTVHYEQFHEHLVNYLQNGAVGELVGAQAAIWRIAYNLPPAKRSLFIPYLMRFLVLMNLPKDALAMQKMFTS